MNHLLKSALLLLGCLVATCELHAQDILYSAYQKYDIHSGDFSVVGKVGGRLYTYRSTSEGFFLDIWNDSMERAATVVLDFFPQKIYETRFIAYNDKLVVLYQGQDGNEVTQYAAKLDDRGRLQGEPITLGTAKTGFFGATKTYFSSAVSDDRHYIVTYAPVAKGTDLNVSGTLLDEDLHIVRRFRTAWKGDNDVSYGEALVGNDATFYLPAFMQTGGHNYADELFMLALPKDTTRLTVTELPLNNLYAAGTFMRLDNNAGHIYIGGFYSDKKNGNYQGVLYASYDVATRNFSINKHILFDEQMRNESGERSKKRAFNDYQVRQLIIRNDGGFVLLSEDYYMTTRNGYTPYGYYGFAYSPYITTPTIREYHYGDILALSYSGDGVREWDAFIRKDQFSQEDGGKFSSYALLNSGGSLGFLFNDFNTSRSRIQLAAVDADGKTDIRPLDAGGADDPDWLPRSAKQVSAHELIVPCLRKRQICFAKVVF